MFVHQRSKSEKSTHQLTHLTAVLEAETAREVTEMGANAAADVAKRAARARENFMVQSLSSRGGLVVGLVLIWYNMTIR